MGRRQYALSAVIAVILGILVALIQQRATEETGSTQLVVGRKNTVLLISNTEYGLSNVHLATSFALLERHPSIDVHYASFSAQAKRIHDLNNAAIRNKPDTAIMFHELPGRDMAQVYHADGRDFRTMVSSPGRASVEHIARSMDYHLAPWEASEHLQIYSKVQAIIAEVDPAVVVLDRLLTPAVDATRNLNRLHAFVSPNTLADTHADQLPQGQALWKYPCYSSGFPYPVPWRLIPENIYLVLKLAFSHMYTPDLDAKRQYLAANGVKEPLQHTMLLYRPDVPWIAGQMIEASLPFDPLPTNVSIVGPIVLSTAPVAEQDPALAAWLAQRPTVLIYLGSLFEYEEADARTMIEALKDVLAQTDVQILWKFKQLGEYSSDNVWHPIQEHLLSGRVRVEEWLSVDPPALLESGHVVASVHHGGANCYVEAIA